MRSSRSVTISFLVSTAASVGLAVVYVAGGQPQLEGMLLGLALGGAAVGFVLLAKNFLPEGPFVEERDIRPGEVREERRAEAAFERSADQIDRRGFFGKLIALAFGALGLAAVFPVRSLGTRPGRDLFETPWAEGLRLVTEEGVPVRADDVPVNGFLTVFPEDHTDAADAQTVLIRLAEDDQTPGPEEATVDGFVAFSKVCTHAGCPVGLYQAATRELFCPCHQSVFAVLEGAEPTAGPATRPLPQLPIGLDENGFLIALGDFPEPIGPGFWNRGR
jgi:ubiquinol-cytochrome c reductase iron-sulfur subunit